MEEEKLLEVWNKAIIIRLFKKQDELDCIITTEEYRYKIQCTRSRCIDAHSTNIILFCIVLL